MLNSCSSINVEFQSCTFLFDLLLQQLYGILGQPSYYQSSISFEFSHNLATVPDILNLV